MTRLSPPARLLVAGLIDWTGTGFYLAISAIFLTRAVGLTPPQVGVALAAVGIVAFAGSVPLGRLADRAGQTQTLLALLIVRAAAFAALATIPALPLTLALLAVIALADHGRRERDPGAGGRARPAARARRVHGPLPNGHQHRHHARHGAGGDRARRRARRSGSCWPPTPPATSPPRCSSQRSAAGEGGSAARQRLLVPSATTALIGVDGLMSMWVVGPQRRPAAVDPPGHPRRPRAGRDPLRHQHGPRRPLPAESSRLVRTYVDAARAQRAAGVLLATTCGCLAASTTGSRTGATLLLIAAVLTLTAAELLKASAAWQITFTLAPPARAAEFFATYGLGRMAAQIGGPVLVTAVVLALGSPGWLLLAALFLAGAAATPPLARAARARPEAARRPPRDPYWPAPRSMTGVIRSSAFGSTVTSSFPPSVLIRSVSFRDSLPLIRVVAGNPPTTT